MKRVYLDTNVLSNLKNKVSEGYADLSKAIDLYKSNLSFVFSPAHIRDKRKDKTDRKLEDFEFMETLVMDNYLSYHGIEGNTSFYLATPRRVFDDGADGQDLSSIVDLLPNITQTDELSGKGRSSGSWVTEEVREKLKENPSLPEDQLELINKAFPEKDRQDLQEMMKRVLEFSLDMYTNHETYKTLRAILDENFNNGKFISNGELDFNKAFEESAFKMSFLEFVNGTLTAREDGMVLYYDFYQQCYLFLDMFGVNKDKIKAKNNFVNLFNDSLHSYYARYCDYFVSDDESTRKKTKALYGLLDISTAVMDTKLFLSEVAVVGTDSESNLLHFFANLWSDISREPEERLGLPEIADGDCICYDTRGEYLNYFDKLGVLRKGEEVLYILCKSDQPMIAKPNYRERGKIVDRCRVVFGQDLQQRDDFIFEQEVAEIKEGSWKGRYWKVCDWLVRLADEEKWGGLILTIAALPKNNG